MVPDRQRFAGLAGYRGVAALLVVFFHTYQFSREGTHTANYLYEGGPLHTLLYSLDTPVAWFFSLSGFLLFLPFAAAVVQQSRPPGASFFLFRRALRILPLYIPAILTVWSLRYTGQPGQWTELFEHLTFTHIWDSRYIFYTIGPVWSLGDEVVFYAMLAIMGPLIYRVTLGQDGQVRKVWLTAFPLGVVAISVAYKVFMHFGLGLPASGMAWLFNPVAHADSFGLGMLLASLSALGFRLSRRISSKRLLTGALVIVGATFLLRTSVGWVNVFAFSLSGLAFTLLLASTVLARRTPQFVQVFNRPVWVYLGAFSYGIYLWHEPLMLELSKYRLLIQPQPQAFWINSLVLVLLSVLVAAITYYILEKPMQSARNLITPEGRFSDDYATERLRYRLKNYRERVRNISKGGAG